MIDYEPTLVSLLSTVNTNVPVYYELFVTSKTKLPCITYRLADDYSIADGDTIFHSKLSYTVKVWASNKDDLFDLGDAINTKMVGAGFKRISTHELAAGTQLCRIMTFAGNGIEN